MGPCRPFNFLRGVLIMYELHHLKGNTYYIDGPTNCGVYVLNDNPFF